MVGVLPAKRGFPNRSGEMWLQHTCVSMGRWVWCSVDTSMASQSTLAGESSFCSGFGTSSSPLCCTRTLTIRPVVQARTSEHMDKSDYHVYILTALALHPPRITAQTFEHFRSQPNNCLFCIRHPHIPCAFGYQQHNPGVILYLAQFCDQWIKLSEPKTKRKKPRQARPRDSSSTSPI